MVHVCPLSSEVPPLRGAILLCGESHICMWLCSNGAGYVKLGFQVVYQQVDVVFAVSCF